MVLKRKIRKLLKWSKSQN